MQIAQDEDDKRKCSFVKFSERNNCILYIHLVIVVNFDAGSLTLGAIFFVELWAANDQRCVNTIVKSTYLMNDSDLCTSYRVICTVYYDALRIFPMVIRKIFWNIFRGHCELVASTGYSFQTWISFVRISFRCNCTFKAFYDGNCVPFSTKIADKIIGHYIIAFCKHTTFRMYDVKLCSSHYIHGRCTIPFLWWWTKIDKCSVNIAKKPNEKQNYFIWHG